MEMIIRQVSVAEPLYQQVLALRDVVLRRPLGMSVYNDDLSKDNDDVIIAAVKKDEVVGCVMMKPLDATTGKLRQMAVADALQGKGLGRDLILYAERTAAAEGFRVLELNARKTALAFYERLGYIAEGDEFTEVGLPHFFMKKRLHEQAL